MASKKIGRRVSVEIDGTEDVEIFETLGGGYQEFDDYVWSGVTIPPGKSRLLVKFLDDRVNFVV